MNNTQENQVKYIIFDLSEVLINGLMGVEEVLGERLGLDKNHVAGCLLGEHFNNYLTGKIDEDCYLEGIIFRENWAIGTEDMKEIIRRNFHSEVGGTVEILHKLSEKYRLILLSDHSKEWIEYIAGIHSFFEHFERIYYSYQLGMTKKNPEIFRMVLKSLEARGEECLFIDDSEVNINNARLSGIWGIHFKDSGQLREYLLEKGILQARQIR